MFEIIYVLIITLIVFCRKLLFSTKYSSKDIAIGGNKISKHKNNSKNNIVSNFKNYDKQYSNIKKLIKEYESSDKEVALYYNNIKSSIKYCSTPLLEKTNCHIGQRKLLLNEIQFMSYYTAMKQNKKKELIIYIGSAPCEHLTIIKDLFPNKKYLLIDPNYHLIDDKIIYIYQNVPVISKVAMNIYKLYKNNKKHQRNAANNLHNIEFLYDKSVHNVVNIYDNNHINSMKKIEEKFKKDKHKTILKDIYDDKNETFVIQDYMTIELSELLKKSKNPWSDIFIISDIRTNLFEAHPSDLDVIYNNIIQWKLLVDLKPKNSMLKFHPPYQNNEKYMIEIEKYMNKDPKLNIPKFRKYIYDIIIPYIEIYQKKLKINIFEDYYSGKYHYLDNDIIFIQPWAPKASSEARLITSNLNYKIYKKEEWENKFKYITMMRQYKFNDIILKQIKKFNIEKYWYCGCYDCLLEQCIILYYIFKKCDMYTNYHDLLSNIKDLDKQYLEKIPVYYNLINKFSGYNLHNRKNNKCLIHGWNTKPKKINYYFVYKNKNEVLRIDSNLNEKIINLNNAEEYKLTDTFDENFLYKNRNQVMRELKKLT